MVEMAITAKPADNWARYSKKSVMEPSAERLNAEHQLVIVRNTDARQPHIIIDRFQVGHELQAGQAKEIDMLKTDIEFFVSQRDPNRKDNLGQPKPLHPVVVEGIKPPEQVDVPRSSGGGGNQNRR